LTQKTPAIWWPSSRRFWQNIILKNCISCLLRQGGMSILGLYSTISCGRCRSRLRCI
jgi:hypothetical protein